MNTESNRSSQASKFRSNPFPSRFNPPPNPGQAHNASLSLLCCFFLFLGVIESIMMFFSPVLDAQAGRLQDIDAMFLSIHAMLFSHERQHQLKSPISKFLISRFIYLLDDGLTRNAKGWAGSRQVVTCRTMRLFLPT
jgi:hypothetical protein